MVTSFAQVKVIASKIPYNAVLLVLAHKTNHINVKMELVFPI
jgi:hypothetical protein